jgi:hypothetical protein
MRKFIYLIAATVIILAAFYSCNTASSKEPATPLTKEEMVNRGSYLVNAIGCDDCHSPKRMGPKGPEIIPELRFSGYPADRPILPPDTNALKKGWLLMGGDLTTAVGPFGVSFSANITSDETGIGNWSEDSFVKAIRTGMMKGAEDGRPMLPPMPWVVYRNFTDEDLKSIFAFLKTVKPVANVVPAPILFPPPPGH